MLPGISTGETPPFHKLSPRTFEKLCRDLFREVPQVETCDLYGIPGQTQNGIDLQAYLERNKGIDVGQCKCYAKFSAADIKKASDAFFKHWPKVWRKKKVRRFVLILACDVDDTDSREMIRKERARFKRRGVHYEVWSGSMLKTKLAPHRHIVSTYCVPAEHWVREICGVITPNEVAGVSSRYSVQVEGLLLRQNARLLETISEDADQRIEAFRVAWQEGRRRQARTGLTELQGARDRWEALTPKVRARALRLLAAMDLEVGEVGAARQLATEAAALDPDEPEHRLMALLALYESGRSAALDILKSHDDPQSTLLQAAIAVAEGRNTDALALLERPSVAEYRPAEAYRIQALAHLGSRDHANARKSIDQALDSGRNLIDVRYTAAIIDYYEGLVPAALPARVPAWPVPVDWFQIRRGVGVSERLQAADTEFGELAASEGLPDPDRQLLEGWRLACMAIHIDRQDAAKAYANSLLRITPGHVPAIWWALHRNYSFAISGSIDDLRRRVTSSNDPSVTICLVACLLAAKLNDEANSVLADEKDTFRSADATAQWEYWRIRTLIASRDVDGLRMAAPPSGSPAGRIAELGVLQLEAEASGDYSPVLRRLDDFFKETDEPAFLLEACEIAARHGKWEFVGNHADDLVSDSLLSAETLRLALFALFNIGKYERCLGLIEQHQGVFAQAGLPTEVRELRSRARSHLGILPQAISEAEELARESPTPSTYLHLAQLYLDIGDLRSLAALSQRLVSIRDVPVEHLLRLAAILRASDRRIATALFRDAFRKGVPDEFIAGAHEIASTLGLSDERQRLLDRLMRLAREGRAGATVGTYTEFAEWVEGRRSETQEIERRYRAGQIPAHFVAGALSWNLAEIYHARPLLCQVHEWSDERPMALIRSGIPRVSAAAALTPQSRLNIDVTSLLVAAHLDILPIVETAFARLRIPQDAMRCLAIFRDQLLIPNPEAVEASRSITDLVDNGKLHLIETVACPAGYDDLVSEVGPDWVGLLLRARADDAQLVFGGSAAETGAPLPTPPELRQHLTPALEVVRLLAGSGSPDPVKVSPPLSKRRQPRLEPGATLYLDTLGAAELARAGVLPTACSQFDVQMLASTIRAARSVIAEDLLRARLDEWLAQLQDRVRSGIQAGTYELIPRAEHADVEREPLPASLLSLIQFTAIEDDVVWVDDRYANSFGSREGVPVVSIVEILDSLLAADRISTAEHHGYLLTLREGNFGFIPLSSEEIVYRLHEVRVSDEHLVETPHLRTLRRYVASCQLRVPHLIRPVSDALQPESFGELSFAFELSHEISRAISRVWQSGEAAECQAKAEWIYHNLSVDAAIRMYLLGRVVDDDTARRMKGMHLASILGFGVNIWAPGDAGARDRFRQFSAWFQDRVLAQEAAQDDRTLDFCATELRRLLRDIAVGLGDAPARQRRRVLHQLILDFPEDFRERLISDEAFASAIRLPVMSVVRLGDLTFPKDRYLEAAGIALNGQCATAVPLGRSDAVKFEKRDSGEGVAFSIQVPARPDHAIVNDPTLAVLLDPIERRIEALGRCREWLEGTTVDETIRQIATIDLPESRLAEIVTWRDESTTFYYQRLESAMRQTRRFTETDARPPNVAGYVRYLRLSEWSSNTAFTDALSKAVQMILRDGAAPVEVLARIAGIPCRYAPLCHPRFKTTAVSPAM